MSFQNKRFNNVGNTFCAPGIVLCAIHLAVNGPKNKYK